MMKILMRIVLPITEASRKIHGTAGIWGMKELFSPVMREIYIQMKKSIQGWIIASGDDGDDHD